MLTVGAHVRILPFTHEYYNVNFCLGCFQAKIVSPGPKVCNVALYASDIPKETWDDWKRRYPSWRGFNAVHPYVIFTIETKYLEKI